MNRIPITISLVQRKLIHHFVRKKIGSILTILFNKKKKKEKDQTSVVHKLKSGKFPSISNCGEPNRRYTLCWGSFNFMSKLLYYIS